MTLFKSIFIFAILALTLWLSEAIKPVPNTAAEMNAPDLEQIIPGQFGEWTELNTGLPQIVSAEEKKSIDSIYSQTLSRVYKDNNQHQIILSLAYGPNQTDPKRIHKPEVCYPAQGFNIESDELRVLTTPYLDIPVKFLKGVSQRHTEYITYWIVVGGVAVSNDLDFKIQQVKYAMDGKVPDGLLFRVSSLGKEPEQEFKLHSLFVNDLLASLKSDTREFVLGNNNDS